MESRKFIDKPTADSQSGIITKVRGGRYLRKASRFRRRPAYDLPLRNMQRPGDNYPNFHLSRNYFKPGVLYNPMHSNSRNRYYRENWRQKWLNRNKPYYNDDEEVDPMDPEPYDHYDDVEEMKTIDPWYAKNYHDGYDDVLPVPSKYAAKRSPGRFSYFPDYVRRQKVRTNYDIYKGLHQEPSDEWPERNSFTKNYKELLDFMAPNKKYIEEDTFPSHRFKISTPNSYKFEEDELDFPNNLNIRTRRYKTEPAVIQTIQRRPVADESRYAHDYGISKYLTDLRTSYGPKEGAQEPIYSAKYRGFASVNQDEKKKNENGRESTSTDINTVPDWKRNQKQTEYQDQYVPSNKVIVGYDKSQGGDTTTSRSENYKNDKMLASELIAYMSADPSEPIIGKEERYLHLAYPFHEKPSDHDILKATFPRKISPVIDQDLEITFDERMGDWKHN